MGFFDTVKDKANALASDAGRASTVTAAQARVVVLQREVRKAERELGHAAFDLIERGELEPAGAAEAAARLREAHRALSDKEEEIAAIRAAAGDPHAAAMRLETELSYYLRERSGVVTKLKDLEPREGAGRTSLRNLAEHLLRLWVAQRPKKPASA